MAYEINLHLPRLRMEAVRMVRSGRGVREVARHFGYTPGAVSKWINKARSLPSNSHVIQTQSSRPYHHPHELSSEVVSRILEIRSERNQCAEIIHYRLSQEGIVVSLSSVKRVLRRCGISRFSRLKMWHQYPSRPTPEKQGIVVESIETKVGMSDREMGAITRVRGSAYGVRFDYVISGNAYNMKQSIFMENFRNGTHFGECAYSEFQEMYKAMVIGSLETQLQQSRLRKAA